MDMNSLSQTTDSAGTCGKNVGRGWVSYPCRLDKGHPSDEPCVAPEVPTSVRAHERWEAAKRDAERVTEVDRENRRSAGLVSADAEALRVPTDKVDIEMGDELLPSGSYADVAERARVLRDDLYRINPRGLAVQRAADLASLLGELLSAERKGQQWETPKP